MRFVNEFSSELIKKKPELLKDGELMPYRASKLLGISLQTFINLQNTAQTMSLKNAYKFEDVAVKELGWSSDKFWKKLRSSEGIS